VPSREARHEFSPSSACTTAGESAGSVSVPSTTAATIARASAAAATASSSRGVTSVTRNSTVGYR
jgi:hypothetical protein